MGWWENSGFVPGRSLVKYGPLQHMTSLLLGGQVFLRRASGMVEMDGDQARQDDELARTFEGEAEVDLGDVVLTDRTNVKVLNRAQQDYYVYSLSKELSPSLLQTFRGADACVVIQDGKTFAQKCLESLKESEPGLAAWATDVHYFDPCDITRTNVFPMTEGYVTSLCEAMGLSREQFDGSPLVDRFLHEVSFWKPNSFESQAEYRCVAWFPSDPGRGLRRSKTVAVGNQESSARLLTWDAEAETLRMG